MSETTDIYTVSFKTGAGYEASLVVARGNTVEELSANIDALTDGVLQKVAETEILLQKAAMIAKGFDPDAAPAAAPAAPTAPPAAAPAATMTCAHGIRVRRNGTSARGAWVGHFCPLAKGDPNQCKPIFE